MFTEECTLTILDEILEHKRKEVAAAEEAASKDPLWLVKALEAAPPPQPFAAALRGSRGPNGKREPQGTLRVIAEIKKASPSKGVIRHDLDPAAIARSYQQYGASAISALTDERFFQGSLENLRLARAASRLPILRKEFIIRNSQVYEARAAGADCILLIAGFIPWDEIQAMCWVASTYNMDVLLEVHNADDLTAALAMNIRPALIGINNRDLRSPNFETNLDRTEELIRLIPPEITVVSESGIRDHNDVCRLARLGVDAILVGEHLMREPDPGLAIIDKLGIIPPSLSAPDILVPCSV